MKDVNDVFEGISYKRAHKLPKYPFRKMFVKSNDDNYRLCQVCDHEGKDPYVGLTSLYAHYEQHTNANEW